MVVNDATSNSCISIGFSLISDACGSTDIRNPREQRSQQTIWLINTFCVKPETAISIGLVCIPDIWLASLLRCFEYKPSTYLTPSIARSTGPSSQTYGAEFPILVPDGQYPVVWSPYSSRYQTDRYHIDAQHRGLLLAPVLSAYLMAELYKLLLLGKHSL